MQQGVRIVWNKDIESLEESNRPSKQNMDNEHPRKPIRIVVSRDDEDYQVAPVNGHRKAATVTENYQSDESAGSTDDEFDEVSRPYENYLVTETDKNGTADGQWTQLYDEFVNKVVISLPRFATQGARDTLSDETSTDGRYPRPMKVSSKHGFGTEKYDIQITHDEESFSSEEDDGNDEEAKPAPVNRYMYGRSQSREKSPRSISIPSNARSISMMDLDRRRITILEERSKSVSYLTVNRGLIEKMEFETVAPAMARYQSKFKKSEQDRKRHLENVPRLYVRPYNLRRKSLYVEEVPQIPSPVIITEVEEEPLTGTTGFKCKRMDHKHIPGFKSMTTETGFGPLTGCIKSITLRAHDSFVIPGGPFRMFVYLTVLKPIVVMGIECVVHESYRFSAGRPKASLTDLSEKDYRVSRHVSLLSKPGIRTREPPPKFSFELDEFQQSAKEIAHLEENCYLPYRGPLTLTPGYYAIPCVVPISNKNHPSITLKQTSEKMKLELVHEFNIRVELQMKMEESDPNFHVLSTGRLPMKVISCGPTPRKTSTGTIIPAVSETFMMQDFHLLFQVDTLVLQEGEAINMYVFSDKSNILRKAEAKLLRIFHVPEMKLFDEKALYRLNKFPNNVSIQVQAESKHLANNELFPFGERAESLARSSGFMRESHLSSAYDQANGLSDPSRISNVSFRTDYLAPERRSEGLHIQLVVPNRTMPQINMPDMRISYYIRLNLTIGRKVLAYSIPITIVETQIEDYEINYLSNVVLLEDRAFLKLNRENRCATS